MTSFFFFFFLDGLRESQGDKCVYLKEDLLLFFVFVVVLLELLTNLLF